MIPRLSSSAVPSARAIAGATARAGRIAGVPLGAIAVVLLLAASPASAFISGSFGLQRRGGVSVNVEPLKYHGGPVLHSSNSYAIYWDPTESYRLDWRRLIDAYFQSVGAASSQLGNVFAVDAQYVDSGGGASNRSTFRGAYTDLNPYPGSGSCIEPGTLACLTDEQIRTELQKVIASGALPGATGPAVYYLLTPPGVTVCTGGGSPSTCSNSTKLTAEPKTGICGYHSVIGGSSPITYVVQPWVAGNAGFIEATEPSLKTFEPTNDVLACQSGSAPLEEPNQAEGADLFNTYAQGLADVIINDLSIEQNDVVVDPYLNGWYQTATSAEQADMCKGSFGPPPESPPTPNPHTHAANLFDEEIGAKYYLQWGFDSVGLTSTWGFSCWQGVSLQPHFTAPNPINSGDVAGFDAAESDITLNANLNNVGANEPYVAPIYRWNFGDGSGAVSNRNAAPVFHSYTYGGTYNVVLTVTDSGGNTASVSNPVTVIGPPPPSPEQVAQAQAQSTSSSASSSAGGSSGSGTKPVVNPAATASIVSRSLRNTLRSGLVVRYSVNERVTGRFEVLLATSIARRIGLHGSPATGLAKGTAPQTIIGRAILVTTAGGRNSVKIQFSKATADRLRRLHNVSVMLRLIVRNASAGSTTVLSTISLSG